VTFRSTVMVNAIVQHTRTQYISSCHEFQKGKCHITGVILLNEHHIFSQRKDYHFLKICSHESPKIMHSVAIAY